MALGIFRVVVVALTAWLSFAATACTKKSTDAEDEVVAFEKRPLPVLAEALPVPSGDAESFAEILAQAMHDPAKAEPATVTAFGLLGLPVTAHDGKLATVPGVSPRGVPTPAWVIQFLATNAQRAPAVNLGHLFASLSVHPDFKGIDLGPLVLRDWSAAFQAPEQGRVDAAAALLQIGGPMGPPGSDTLGNAKPEEINLSALQAQLLLRRLAQEIVLPEGGPPPSLRAAPRLISAKEGQGAPCSMSHDQEKVVNDVVDPAYRKIFNEVIKALRDKGIISPGSNLENNLKAGSFVVDLANYALLLASLHVDAGINSSPLVRTHDQLAGEQRTLTALVYFDAGKAAMVNCWKLAFQSVGLTGLKVPDNGALGNVKVSFRARQGIDPLEFDPIAQFRAPTEVKTKDEGKNKGTASVTVEGRPQRRKLPDNAPPVDKTATVSIQVIPTDTSFFSDLEKLFKLALAKGKVGPSMAIEMLKRMNPVPFLYDIPVRDWQGGRRFTLNGSFRWTHDPVDHYNPLDSDGDVSFTGEMGCVPPDAGSPTWICAGDLTLNGNGTAYYLDPVPHQSPPVCVYGWTARSMVLKFTGDSAGANLDAASLTRDPSSPAEPDFRPVACKIAELELVLPIDIRAIGHPLELPEPGKGWQVDYPLTFNSGTVNLTILSDD